MGAALHRSHPRPSGLVGSLSPFENSGKLRTLIGPISASYLYLPLACSRSQDEPSSAPYVYADLVALTRRKHRASFLSIPTAPRSALTSNTRHLRPREYLFRSRSVHPCSFESSVARPPQHPSPHLCPTMRPSPIAYRAKPAFQPHVGRL